NLTAGSLTFTCVLGIGERNLLHGGINRSAHVMGDISPDFETFFRVSLVPPKRTVRLVPAPYKTKPLQKCRGFVVSGY
ncbi:hypothetical protein K5E40_12815, partial [Pseudomonas baetica]|uniref:hypothetical protein n=1 Tax=Pseudomonas baetica TaxID=674054 RepID=UPI001C8CC3A8